ncbi:hypothetical protein GPJ56_008097 [Histomonas meleagridis]|uniref:uncharacterized protein n=1 Tax=Histomonas meleagridis TaxID=135588 RepID=UPI003559C218|nr:hypothetical protein GPJ56_008097 [Histomonas meleagridis]KAH0798952.1 hypothetical protein GO595_008242 [Histomonas meleagridis]
MLLLLLGLRALTKPHILIKDPKLRFKHKEHKPESNKINWGKVWKGIKTAFKVITTIVQVALIFLDEDENVLYINGYKVTDVVAGEDGRPKEVTLDNGVNKFVIRADIKELATGEFSWAKFWEGIQKLLEYISKLFQTQELALEDDTVTFGDYEITDVKLNDDDVAEYITLENPSGNKITFHLQIGAANEEKPRTRFSWKRPHPHHGGFGHRRN